MSTELVDGRNTPAINGLLIHAIDGIDRFPGAEQLAKQYRENRILRTTSQQIQALIVAESAATLGTGLLTNISKLFIPLGVPSNRYVVWLNQIRLSATIAVLHGTDPREPQVQTLLVRLLLGDSAEAALAEQGIAIPQPLTLQTMAEISAEARDALLRLAERTLTATAAAPRETKTWRDQVVSTAGAVVDGIDPRMTAAIGAEADRIFRAAAPAAAAEPATETTAPPAEPAAAAEPELGEAPPEKRGWFGRARGKPATTAPTEPAALKKTVGARFNEAKCAVNLHAWKWIYLPGTPCDQIERCAHCPAERNQRTAQHVFGQLEPVPGQPCQRAKTCSQCGTMEAGEPVHSFDTWKYQSEASCVQIWFCANCSTTNVGKLLHDFTPWQATKENPCFVTRKCRHCGESQAKQLEHEWDLPVYVHGKSSSSCESAKSCKNCGVTEPVEPRHEYGPWQEVGPYVCEQFAICSRCHDRTTQPMPHRWSAPESEKGTCVQIKTCTRCSEQERGEIRHRPEPWKLRSPTSCQYVRYCPTCDRIVEEGDVKHQEVIWKPDTQLRCREFQYCRRCSQDLTEERFRHEYEFDYFDPARRPCYGCNECKHCGYNDPSSYEYRHIWLPYKYLNTRSCVQTTSCKTCGAPGEEKIVHPPEKSSSGPWNDNPQITRTVCRQCEQESFDHQQLTTKGRVAEVTAVTPRHTRYVFTALISGRKIMYDDSTNRLSNLVVGNTVHLVLTYEDKKFHVQHVRKQG